MRIEAVNADLHIKIRWRRKRRKMEKTQLVAKSKKIFGFVHNFLDRGKLLFPL